MKKIFLLLAFTGILGASSISSFSALASKPVAVENTDDKDKDKKSKRKCCSSKNKASCSEKSETEKKDCSAKTEAKSCGKSDKKSCCKKSASTETKTDSKQE